MSRGRGQGSEEVGMRLTPSALAAANPAEDILNFRDLWVQATPSERQAFIFPEDLDYADFSLLDLRGVDLRNRSLYGADLSGSDLREAALTESDLRSIKWNVDTNFPLDEIDYTVDDVTAEYIDKLKLLTPHERKFTEKNPQFMVTLDNGIKSLFWMNSEGNVETPEVPTPGMEPLPALKRSLLLPNGQEMVITKEFYTDGKLHNHVDGDYVNSARYSSEMDGTIIIENYSHGEPTSPYFSDPADPTHIWEGTQYVRQDILDVFWRECPLPESGLYVASPQKIIARPDGTRTYTFSINGPDPAGRIVIDIDAQGNAEFTRYRDEDILRKMTLIADEIEKSTTVVNADGDTILTTDKFKARHQGRDLSAQERQVDHREQVVLNNKELLESTRFPDGTESIPAKTITTYEKLVVQQDSVLKYERSRIEFYNSRGQLHCLEGPAVCDLDKNGKTMSRGYYVNGRKLRDAQQFVIATQMYRK